MRQRTSYEQWKDDRAKGCACFMVFMLMVTVIAVAVAGLWLVSA